MATEVEPPNQEVLMANKVKATSILYREIIEAVSLDSAPDFQEEGVGEQILAILVSRTEQKLKEMQVIDFGDDPTGDVYAAVGGDTPMREAQNTAPPEPKATPAAQNLIPPSPYDGGVPPSPFGGVPPSPAYGGVPPSPFGGVPPSPAYAAGVPPSPASSSGAPGQAQGYNVPPSPSAYGNMPPSPSVPQNDGAADEAEASRAGRLAADAYVQRILSEREERMASLRQVATEISQEDGEGSDEEFEPVHVKADPGAANDEELNSEDDMDDSDEDEMEAGQETDHIILSTYEKVTKNKNHTWKATLREGIMYVNGRDYPFQKAVGELKLFG